MRKPLEKAAKVLLKNAKSKRCVQTTRDQSVSVQSNPRTLTSLEPPLECPFKPLENIYNPPTSRIPTAGTTKTASYNPQQSHNDDIVSNITEINQHQKSLENSSGPQLSCTKPFSQVPSPGGLPLVGSLFDFIRAGGGSQIHEYVLRRHKQLGPIYKENLGGTETLFVAHPELYKEVHRQEGSYPSTMKPEAFNVYRESHPDVLTGLFFKEGEDWWVHRRKANSLLLKKNLKVDLLTMKPYEDYVTRLLQEWKQIALKNDNVLPKFEHLAYKWGFEGVAYAVLGNSWRRHWGTMNKDFDDFVRRARNIMLENSKMFVAPRLAKTFNTKVWRTFESSMDELVDTCKRLTQSTLEEFEQTKDQDKDKMFEEGGILYRLYNADTFNRQSIVDLAAGFIVPLEPPSVTLMWILNTLGRRLDLQEKIYQEIQTVCGQDTIVNYSHLDDLKLVRMFLKETLRLFPTAPFVCRILPNDSVIGGYQIPARQAVALSFYVSHRNEDFFPNPELFWPERWSRERKENKSIEEEGNFHRHHVGVNVPYAYQPFGLGIRSCLGKMLIQSMLHLMIARTVQQFRVETEDVKPVMQTILVPDRPMNLRLLKRNSP